MTFQFFNAKFVFLLSWRKELLTPNHRQNTYIYATNRVQKGRGDWLRCIFSIDNTRPSSSIKSISRTPGGLFASSLRRRKACGRGKHLFLATRIKSSFLYTQCIPRVHEDRFRLRAQHYYASGKCRSANTHSLIWTELGAVPRSIPIPGTRCFSLLIII